MLLYTPNSFGYHPGWIHMAADDTSVSFEVQACNDARIYLAEYEGVTTSDAYEVVIGGRENQEWVKVQFY